MPIADPLGVSSAVTNVAASATNVTLKAANTSRRGLWVYNDAAIMPAVTLRTRWK